MRQVGRLGIAFGRRLAAALMAACTSSAALSIFLPSANCKVMEVKPSPLLEVISVTPGTALNCTSSGVATEEPMVSALAPGKAPCTTMVG